MAPTMRERLAAECRFELWPPRQKGGQVVGPGPQGVKATHLPTGITATCDLLRSQFYNRDVALDMIEAAFTNQRMPAIDTIINEGRG